MLEKLSVITQILSICAIVFFLYVLWIYYNTRKQLWILIDKIPGPTPLPFVGNALDFYFKNKEMRNLFYGSSRKYPNILRLWFGSKPYVVLNNPTNIGTLLSGSKNINKGNMYTFIIPWLGDGLLTSTDNLWRQQRKMLTPAFHFRILEDFYPILNFHSKMLAKLIHKESVKGEAFDILPFTTRCIYYILCETVMGIEVDWQDDSCLKFLEVTEQIKNYLALRRMKLFLWSDIVFNLTKIGREHNKCVKFLHQCTDEIIQKKKLELTKETDKENRELIVGEKKCLAFLDLLLQTNMNGRKLTDVEIRNQVSTFMFAGHDTISSSMGWTLHFLGSYPEIQNKLFVEIDDIFGNDKERDVTADDVKNLKYMECVIKESLRRMTPVPLISRKLVEDIQIDGYTIPSGVDVIVNLVKLHKNPDIYPNPLEFNPDRFLQCEIGQTERHPYSFVPFSAGPRICIGLKFAMMEMKIVLSHIFRNFTVTSVQTLQQIKPAADLVLTAKNGIKLCFTPRCSK